TRARWSGVMRCPQTGGTQRLWPSTTSLQARGPSYGGCPGTTGRRRCETPEQEAHLRAGGVVGLAAPSRGRLVDPREPPSGDAATHVLRGTGSRPGSTRHIRLRGALDFEILEPPELCPTVDAL